MALYAFLTSLNTFIVRRSYASPIWKVWTYYRSHRVLKVDLYQLLLFNFSGGNLVGHGISKIICIFLCGKQKSEKMGNHRRFQSFISENPEFFSHENFDPLQDVVLTFCEVVISWQSYVCGTYIPSSNATLASTVPLFHSKWNFLSVQVVIQICYVSEVSPVQTIITRDYLHYP